MGRTRSLARAAIGAGAISLAGAIPLAGALAYALMVVWHGYPALRHDWAWPTDAASLASLWTTSTSGWDPSGIGAPNLHLNDYVVGAALCLIGRIAGTFAALFALALGVGLACALGAAALAGSFDAHPVTRAGAALLALFSPWVYVETVAGHTYMLLAFGALAALVAEARRTIVRQPIAALLVALSLVQLQFFLPALAVAAIMAWSRRAWLPLITAVVVAAPVLVGLAAEYGAFRGVPVTLTWELSQSVPLANAAHLTGYFAGYTSKVDPFDAWPMGVVVTLALFGVAVAWRTAAARIIAVAGALSIAVPAGLRGPLAAPMTWAFTHASAAALYRELFDVLGFAAIAYVAATSLASAYSKVARGTLLICGLALLGAWLIWSPWAWWVPAQLVPRATIDAPAGTRFALLPAFQPLKLGDRGSGLDPDDYQHGSVTPLNVQVPQFPIDAALARYALHGDSRWLAALGVSSVVNRPWLHSDAVALKYETALAQPLSRPGLPGSVHVRAQPKVDLLPQPDIVSTVDQLGAGDVLFSDAADARGDGVPQAWSAYRPLVAVRAPDRFVDAKDGWVDARLTFAADPRLAQAFGGAATAAPADALALTAGVPALVFVEGSLVDQRGRTVSGPTAGYRWVPIGADVSAVRCRGLCAVATQGFPPPALPGHVTHAAASALHYSARTPWWYETEIGAGGAGMLRLNEAFDGHWIATLDGSRLPHVRIDATVNGWLLPARSATHSVMMIQSTAALQAALEAVGTLWLLVLSAIAVTAARRGTRALV